MVVSALRVAAARADPLDQGEHALGYFLNVLDAQDHATVGVYLNRIAHTEISPECSMTSSMREGSVVVKVRVMTLSCSLPFTESTFSLTLKTRLEFAVLTISRRRRTGRPGRRHRAGR